MRSFYFLLTACGTASITLAAEAPPAIPTARSAAHYESLIKKSPFAPATPVTAPVAVAPGFASSFYVTGIAKIGGKDFVTIVSKDNQTRFSLMPGETGPDGIVLESVEWADTPEKSKVNLKKGSDVGVAEFDQVALKAPPPPPPPAAPPNPQTAGGGRMDPQSRFNNRQNNFQGQPGTGQNGGQQPSRNYRSGYPQVPPQALQNAQPNVAASPGGEMRHRLRMINSGPQY